MDAKDGSIIEAYHFILLADAKKIALDDAGVSEKVTFTEETLVAGGIKSPYYYFAFESDSARWTYKIDAVLGVIMDKTCDKIIPPAPEFIGLEKAKQIALEDAGLDETAQKIVFTREELSRNSGQALLHSGVLHGQVCVFLQDRCSIRGNYREENRVVFPSGVRDCAGHVSKFRFQAAQGKLIKT